jgi:hypothetical protein
MRIVIPEEAGLKGLRYRRTDEGRRSFDRRPEHLRD